MINVKWCLSDSSRNISKHQKLCVVDVTFCVWQLTVGMAQMGSQWSTTVILWLQKFSSEMWWRPSTSTPLWRMSKYTPPGAELARKHSPTCHNYNTTHPSLESSCPFLRPWFSPSFLAKHCEQIIRASCLYFLMLHLFLTPSVSRRCLLEACSCEDWLQHFYRVFIKFGNVSYYTHEMGCWYSITIQ